MFNTNGKGVFIQLSNGYALSIQWGYGNYCNNRDASVNWDNFQESQRKLGREGSTNAEIAVMDRHDNFCGKQVGILDDDVEGYASPERVLEVLNKLAELPAIS